MTSAIELLPRTLLRGVPGHELLSLMLGTVEDVESVEVVVVVETDGRFVEDLLELPWGCFYRSLSRSKMLAAME